MIDWSIDRIKSATLGQKDASYSVTPETEKERKALEIAPEIFKFRAISVGDINGQLFIVPMDDSSKENAEYILRAIAAYKGG